MRAVYPTALLFALVCLANPPDSEQIYVYAQYHSASSKPETR